MKESFIEQVSDFLLSRYTKDELHNVAVVLPNRRSISELKKYISGRLQGPFLAPDCDYIGDFMLKLSHLQYADYDEQMIFLYRVHTQIAAQYAEEVLSFVEFSSKAQAILQDFNDLDMAMASVSRLYKDVYELKKIDIWSPSGDNDFDNSQYLRFFERMPLYYSLLNDILLKQGKAYQGAVYRFVAEHADDIIRALPYKKVIFVGCQRLSVAETVLLKNMITAEKADILVDADSYYVNNSHHEAGAGIRQLQTLFPDYKLAFINEHFKNIPQKIRIYSLPQQIAQAKFLPQLLAQIQQEQQPNDNNVNDTVIVLPDESVMQALYESMDWKAFPKANVSMGFSLRNTVAYELSDIFLQMAIEAENRGKEQQKVWSVAAVRALLNHPYIKNMFGDHQQEVMTLMRRRCKVYTQSDLETLLNCCKELHDIVLFGDNMLKLMQDIRHFLQYISHTQLSSPEHELEQAYIVALCDYMSRMEGLLSQVAVNDAASLRLLFESYLSVCTIPFDSNREESDLQIMGMSETKTETHQTVVMLSVNEGIMPKGRSVKGLVPYQVRAAYNMSNDEVYDADTAYYFYRLIQRAENIYLLYVSDEKAEGEPSRYLLQLKTELKAYNSQTQVEEYNVVYAQPEFKENNSIEIPKQTLELDIIKESQHSASSINMYLSCTLRYYLKYILNLKVDDNNTENMGGYSADMGSAIHAVLANEGEKFHFKVTYDKPALKEKLLQAFLNLPEKKYRAQDFASGVNSLLLEVSAEYTKRYLDYAKEHYADAQVTIEAEKAMQYDLPADNGCMHLKGFIDRIDIDNTGNADIKDYKTGKVEDNAGRLNSLDTGSVFDSKHDKAIQMLLYAYLYHKNYANPVNSVELVSLRNSHEVPLEVRNYVFDETFFADFESALQLFFEREMCNANIPFSACANDAGCRNCEFQAFCLRLKIEK
ncbi:MAG: PD-(D/E)XK nuclease family protein [Bacteroidales bacterium]|nr:PD-(D/E)XK nuclease family protein [Bacteroidales bacterium]